MGYTERLIERGIIGLLLAFVTAGVYVVVRVYGGLLMWGLDRYPKTTKIVCLGLIPLAGLAAEGIAGGVVVFGAMLILFEAGEHYTDTHEQERGATDGADETPAAGNGTLVNHVLNE